MKTNSGGWAANIWLGGRILVAILLLSWIVSISGGLELLVAELARLSPLVVLGTILVFTLDRLLMAYKWTLLLGSGGPTLSTIKATQLYCASMVWGMLLPATVGADALRIAGAMRCGVPGSRLTASVVVERAFGVLASLLVSVLGIFVLVESGALPARLRTLAWFGLAGLLVGSGLLAASMHPRSYAWASPWLDPVRFPRTKRILEPLRSLLLQYHDFRTRGEVLLAFSCLSLIEQMVPACAVWLLARELGSTIGLLPIVGAMTVSLLVARIPLSFGGIGVMEGSLVSILSAGGMPMLDATAIAVAARLLETASWLPWWAVHLASEGRRASDANAGTSESGKSA